MENKGLYEIEYTLKELECSNRVNNVKIGRNLGSLFGNHVSPRGRIYSTGFLFYLNFQSIIKISDHYQHKIRKQPRTYKL